MAYLTPYAHAASEAVKKYGDDPEGRKSAPDWSEKNQVISGILRGFFYGQDGQNSPFGGVQLFFHSLCGRWSCAVVRSIVSLVCALWFLTPAPTLALCPAVHGDITGDSQVTITDVQCLILTVVSGLNSPGTMPACVAVPAWEVDLDCSASITVTDVVMAINRALTVPLSPTLDADLDDCPDSCQPFCGDGVCEVTENCGTCAAECGCDDGIACTQETCVDGQCAHTPVVSECDDSDPCTADGCDLVLGCTHGPTTDYCACPTPPPCVGPGCGLDGDGDGVLDPCDACPQASPNDANGDGLCDGGNACPCGYTGYPGCATFGVSLIDPHYTLNLINGCLPKGTVDITAGSDGNVYGIRDGAPGPTGDEQLFKVNMTNGKINIVGTIAFTNPATSDLWTLDQAPGGVFTNKLYLTDWISGNPARVDRFNHDLSAPEPIYVAPTGSPVHTITSNVAFPIYQPAYGNYVFFAGQGLGTTIILRDSVTVGVPSQVFFQSGPSYIKDIRALAFGPGGTWGFDLYFAASSMLNGFDNAPGGIYRISSAGQITTVVPESSGLEFGSNLVFDTHGILGGGLFYTQVDGQLFRISPDGKFTLVAKGIARSEPTQAADGSFLVSSQRGLFSLSCPLGVCQTTCGDGICGMGEHCASCAQDCACTDNDPCTTDTCSPTGECTSAAPCPDSTLCYQSVCQPGVGCQQIPNIGTPCDDGTPCTLADACNAQGACQGQPACNDGSACTDDGCMEVPICPVGSPFGTSCYAAQQINVSVASWQTAKNTCTQMGAKLVTIGDAQENIFVRQLANQKCSPIGDRVWIGLWDPDGTGNWQWDSGEPITFMNWDIAAGEPNFIGTQKWVDMMDSGLWRSSEGNLQGPGACVVCELTQQLPLLCTYTPVGDPQAVAQPEICNGADDDCDGVVDENSAAECDDQNPCSQDLCYGFQGCVNLFGEHVCDDGVACTNDSCSETTGCAHEPMAGLCDDGIECTQDLCDVVQGCVYVAHHDLCNDGQTCSVDECDVQSGCVYDTEGSCDDGLVCTSEICLVGIGCEYYTDSAVCDDTNPCTDDLCVLGSGCQHSPNTAPCNDGNACTDLDVCEAGVCTAGTTVVCDDGLACTIDDCDPALGCPSPQTPTFVSECSAPGSLGGYFEGPFNAWGSTNLAFLPDPDWTCKGTLSATIDLSRDPDLLGAGTAYCSSHTTVLFVDFDYEYVLPVKVTGNVVGNTIQGQVKADKIILPWTPTIVLDEQGVPVQLVGQNSGSTSTQAILDTVGSTYPANPQSPYNLTCTANRKDIEGECCNGYGCEHTLDYECYGKGGDFIATEAGQCCEDGADTNPVCVKLTEAECKVNDGYFVPATLGTCCHAPDFCANCTSEGCQTCNWQPCMAISSVLCTYLGGQFSKGYSCDDQNQDGFADVCGPPVGFGYTAPSSCSLVGDALTINVGGVADLTLIGAWSPEGDGYVTNGDISVVTPLGLIDFPGVAEVVVSCGELFSITGTTTLPPEMAGVGAFADAGLEPGVVTPTFSLGYAFGYELLSTGFQGPVSLSRPYIYVFADSGVDFALDDGDGESKIVFKAVEGNALSLAIDYKDPAFSVELEGDMLGGATGQLVKGVGFGISMGGHWMMKAKKPLWDGAAYVPRIQTGHVWRSGEFALIPIPNLPVNIYLEGEVLIDVGESVDKITAVAQGLAALVSGSVDGQLGQVLDPVGVGETLLGMELLANANQVHIEILDMLEFTIGDAAMVVEDGGLSFVGEGFSPGATLASGEAGPLFEAFSAITLQQTYEVKGWVDGFGFEVEVLCDLVAGPFALNGVTLILSSADGIRIQGGSFSLDFGAFLNTLSQLFQCEFSSDGASCKLGGIPVANFSGGIGDGGFYLNATMGVPVFGNIGFSATVAGDGKFQLTGKAAIGIVGLNSQQMQVTLKNNGFALSTKVSQFAANFDVSGSMDTSGHFVLTGKAEMGFGAFKYSSVAVTIDSKVGMTMSGTLGVNIIGSQVKMTGTYPFGGGQWSLYGVQTVNILGFQVSNMEFWINQTAGLTAKGKLSFAGMTATISGAFAINGLSFELKGATELSPGGFKLANAQLTVTQSGVSLSGKLSILGKSFDAQGQVQSNGNFTLKAYGSVDFWIGKLLLGENYTVTFPPNWNLPPYTVDNPILFSKVGSQVTVSGNASMSVSGLGGVSGKFNAYSNGSFQCALTAYKSVNIAVDVGVCPACYEMKVGSVGGEVTVDIWNFGASMSFAAQACAYSLCSPKLKVGLGTNGEFSFPVPGMGSLSFDLW